MGIRRFISSVLPGSGSVDSNILDVKNIIETNAPDFFTKMEVNGRQINTETYATDFEFYDNDMKIATYHLLAYNGTTFRYADYVPYRYTFFTHTHAYTFNTLIDDVTNEGFNPGASNRPIAYDNSGNKVFIYEVIIINENVIALSLTSENSERIDICKSPGIIIFAKTDKGRISVISPNTFLSCKPESSLLIINKSGYFPNSPIQNYLSCITYESQTGTPYFSNICYGGVSAGDKTILNPLIVKGTNDFIPDVFYVPVSQYILNNTSDASFYIGNDRYYYNGFIAVKINE